MSINALIEELKENNQDFEFYPTTDAMLSVIQGYIDNDTVLDIGCGTCKFKKFMGSRINQYYVMEKSKILLEKLDDDAICLGTDFMASTLIDKKVTTIFCNPPYSEFKEWVKKIISEGNYKQAFLVIPQRWKDDAEIKSMLEAYHTKYHNLGEFDFYDAERAARAKVDVVRFYKEKYQNSYRSQEDFDMDSFNVFFNKTFGLNKSDEEMRKERLETDTSRSIEREKDHKQRVKDALVAADESKASILVKLYNQDYETLIKNLNAIMQLDEDILETFNISVKNVKEALIQKMRGLKVLYWDMVWNEFEEITERLTTGSRERIKQDFDQLYCVDFTLENIYVLILWVIKNANKFYDSQLIDLYKKLSDVENVKPYKSNTKLFEKDGWRWSCEGKTNYCLDYRIIASSPFRVSYSGKFERDWYYRKNTTLEDICVVAKNLGFEAEELIYPNNFGEKTEIMGKDGRLFMDYKVYKNNNMHMRFNKEFTKAMNVEVSRLLGWIRSKEDIAREFPEELAKGAEKYFKANYTCIGTNGLLMLTTKGE